MTPSCPSHGRRGQSARRHSVRRHASAEALEPRRLLSTTNLAVVNPDFSTFYKPGSTTVTAIVPSNVVTDGIGPGVPVADVSTGQAAVVSFSDGTRGTAVDVPGWTAQSAAPFSPPGSYVGVLGDAPGATQPPPAGTEADAFVVGSYPQGELITQTLSGVSLLPDTTYVLSADATAQDRGGAAPPALVIGLDAGATRLTPDGSADPSPESGGASIVSGTFTRTYKTGHTPPAGPLTIVLGVAPETTNASPSANFSAVHLTASNVSPGATLVAPVVTAAGATTETVTATYTSAGPGTGINLASIAPGNLAVAGPGGKPLTVTGVTTNPATGSPASVTATYTVAAPAGGWSAADNGTYAVSLLPGQVTDTAGAAAPATNTTFAVSVLPAGLSAGAADPTFASDSGGRASLGFSGQSSAVASNGSILVAGQQLVPAGTPGAPAGSHGVVERLNADGTPDATFGTAGVVIDAATNDEEFYDVLPLADGRVLVAGASGGDLLLARYNADGTPDATFGTGGRVTAAVAGTGVTAYALAVDPGSGAIVVGGAAGGQFLLDRFTAAGAADPAFNSGQPLLLGSPSGANAIGRLAFLGDGRVVGAGTSGGSVAVVRVTADGLPDVTFGAGGVATVTGLSAEDLGTGVRDYTEGLALQSDGKILVANHTPGGDLGVARLNTDGSPDASFGAGGAGGVVGTDLGGSDDADFVGLAPDGRRIFAAGTTTSSGGVTQTTVVAYTPSGALDTTFATGGEELLPFGTAVSSAPPTPAGSVVPQAEGSGMILAQMQRIFAALRDRTLLVGASSLANGTASSSLARLVTGAASDPLPTGTLGVTVSGKLPASLVAGARANAAVNVTVTNPTGQLVSGPVTVSLLVSPAATLTGATPLLTKTLPIRLKAGKSKTVKLRVASFPSVPGGAYTLVATAKAPDGTTTGAAGPTTSIQAAFVAVKLTAVRAPSTPAAAGRSASATLTLTNSGNEPASGAATLTLTGTLSTSSPAPPTPFPLGTQRLPVKLKPGQTVTRRVKVSLPAGLTPGSYTLTATLDVVALGDASAADGVATAASPLVVK